MEYEPLPSNNEICPICKINTSYCTGKIDNEIKHKFHYNNFYKSFDFLYDDVLLLYHPDYGYRIDFNPENFSFKEISIEPFELKDYQSIIERYKKLKVFL